MNEFYSKKDVQKKKILDFYRIKKNFDTYCKYIDEKSPIALRLVDHFVTTYSRNHCVSYIIHDEDTNESSVFIVHDEYKNELKIHQKKDFDPFSRGGKKITIQVGNHAITTPMCQLNFFKWAIENKILEYIEQNKEEISQGMKDAIAENKEYKLMNNSSRRRSLSKSSKGTIFRIPKELPVFSDQIESH